MNKKLSMLLPVIATCGLLAGCGTDYYTKDSTVFVAKNGSVVSTDVEDFDTAAYKQDDLQSYVDKSIDDYNKKNDGSIKLYDTGAELSSSLSKSNVTSLSCLTEFNISSSLTLSSAPFSVPSVASALTASVFSVTLDVPVVCDASRLYLSPIATVLSSTSFTLSTDAYNIFPFTCKFELPS